VSGGPWVVLSDIEADTSPREVAGGDNQVSETVSLKGETMPIRLALFVVYLAYALASGNLAKHGSGLDPLGQNPPPPPLAPTLDQGSGADPMG